MGIQQKLLSPLIILRTRLGKSHLKKSDGIHNPSSKAKNGRMQIMLKTEGDTASQPTVMSEESVRSEAEFRKLIHTLLQKSRKVVAGEEPQTLDSDLETVNEDHDVEQQSSTIHCLMEVNRNKEGTEEFEIVLNESPKMTLSLSSTEVILVSMEPKGDADAEDASSDTSSLSSIGEILGKQGEGKLPKFVVIYHNEEDEIVKQSLGNSAAVMLSAHEQKIPSDLLLGSDPAESCCMTSFDSLFVACTSDEPTCFESYFEIPFPLRIIAGNNKSAGTIANKEGSTVDGKSCTMPEGPALIPSSASTACDTSISTKESVAKEFTSSAVCDTPVTKPSGAIGCVPFRSTACDKTNDDTRDNSISTSRFASHVCKTELVPSQCHTQKSGGSIDASVAESVSLGRDSISTLRFLIPTHCQTEMSFSERGSIAERVSLGDDSISTLRVASHVCRTEFMPAQCHSAGGSIDANSTISETALLKSKELKGISTSGVASVSTLSRKQSGCCEYQLYPTD